MRIAFVRRCAFAVYLLVSSAATSFAIGPNTQTVSPTYNSVVRILTDAGLPNGQGFMEGTGSVVANQNVNGSGYLWVLTADHVVSSNGTRAGATSAGLGLAFGNSPTSSGNSTYFASATADTSHIFRGGDNGLKDMALFGVNYGAYDPAKDALAVSLRLGNVGLDFSEIGYGNQGNVTGTGYQAQNSYGTERYYNQRTTGLISNWADPQGYQYRAFTFDIQDPTDSEAPAASGAALDADSGSPWFANNFSGSYYTTGQFAILTGINQATPGGLFAFGSTERALAFVTADLNWIHSIVPEPGSVTLIIIVSGLCAVHRPRLHA